MRPTLGRGARALLALTAVAGAARSQGAQPEPVDVARAEQLFRDAKLLADAKRFDEACPKFAESRRLDPSGGTLLALALCYEAEGKTASAWGAFYEAARYAARDRRADREKLARAHASALERRLSHVTLRLPAGDASGFVVRIDETTLGHATLDAPIPVDPGPHAISVSAPGKRTWATSINVGPDADAPTVSVPPLPDAPAAPPSDTPPATAAAPPLPVTAPPSPAPVAPPAVDPPPVASSTRTPLGYGALGLGVVAIAAGGYFGLHAKSLHDQARDLCPGSPCASDEGIAKNDDARGAALGADISFGIGVAALAAGAYLLLTRPAPARAASRPALAPSLVAGPRGAAFRLAF